jgi:DNA mismatch endonuclease, patch repair protein
MPLALRKPKLRSRGYPCEKQVAVESNSGLTKRSIHSMAFQLNNSRGYQLSLTMDTMTVSARSALMARIRAKNTKPEMFVRRLMHGMGFRYRLHCADLPGRPDIVLPRHRKIVQVQGCFWHGHDCQLGSKPKSNTRYWIPKIQGNRARDARHRASLIALGWDVLELWECDIRKGVNLEKEIRRFMRRKHCKPCANS